MPSNGPGVGQFHYYLKMQIVSKILSKWDWTLCLVPGAQLPCGSPCCRFVWLILAAPSSILNTKVCSTFFSYPHPSLSQVVPHVVHLVQSLRTDGLPNSKAFLLQFTELIHCMMYQYSGFPDLYDNILEAIKVKELGTSYTFCHRCLWKCWSPVISRGQCINNQDLFILALLLKCVL